MSFKKGLHVYNTQNIKCTLYGHCMIIKHEMSLVKNYSKKMQLWFPEFYRKKHGSKILGIKDLT